MTELVRAGPAYAPALAAIHKSAFPHDPWDEKTFATLLAQPGTMALLHPQGGFLLLRIAADEAEILTIAAAIRRQGIGTALVQAAIDAATAAGATAMYLEVAATNAAARALYQTHNFETAGSRRAYYADGEDALILRRSLTAR